MPIDLRPRRNLKTCFLVRSHRNQVIAGAGAYVMRYIGSCREGHADMKKILKLEPVVPREDLAAPTVCIKHARPVVYDGDSCPLCKIVKVSKQQAEAEFLKLTKNMA